MTIKLGMEAKLYRNTGTYALPTWVEMINVKDLTLNLEAGEADVTTRGNAGWKATIAALKDGSIEFERHGRFVLPRGEYRVPALNESAMAYPTIRPRRCGIRLMPISPPSSRPSSATPTSNSP